MKKVFIAGSRKFYDEIQNLAGAIQGRGSVALLPEKQPGVETFEHEQAALRKAFDQINIADLVYVVTPEGYIGKTVAIELGYAFAKGKPIFASAPLEELAARALVSQVQITEDFLQTL